MSIDAASRRPVGGWLRPAALAGLLAILAVTYGAAWVGSAFTLPNLVPWYESLVKPSFNPPNAVFGPVWSVLYALMALAAWRVWWRGRSEVQPAGAALTLYAVQLFLNVGWSITFFGLHGLAASLWTILLLLAAIVATTVAFYRLDRIAAALMVPYIAWVGFATLLNLSIFILNP